jgi:hypothetical protein
MRPVSPVIPESNAAEVVYAKDQPEYQPLPSIRRSDGAILTRWVLSEQEKRAVAEQGFIYLEVLTFNKPLQPLLLSTEVPDEFTVAMPSAEQWPDVIQ